MKHVFKFMCVTSISLFVLACANPNKAQKLDTTGDKMKGVGDSTSVGLNKNGEMISRKKVEMADHLQQLQRKVYTLEEEVYGSDEFGNRGKWGVLKDCMKQVNSKDFGGDGKIHTIPDRRQVTKKETQMKIGLDESGNLVGISDEFLKDRIERFNAYQDILEKDKDFYDDKTQVCQALIEEKKFDAKAIAKLDSDVTKEAKVVKAYVDPMIAQMDTYLCAYVKPGASLKEMITHAVEVGWIKEEDLKDHEVGSEVKDATGYAFTHTTKLGNWALAFDKSYVYGELMNEAGADAGLAAWMNSSSKEVAGNENCLPARSGRWNKTRK
jgi:hypothetical protein